MQEIVDTLTTPAFLATMLAAVSAFATILAVVMPMLARDQLNQRMRVMALERDKLRSQRIAELSKERGGPGSLRRTPKRSRARERDRGGRWSLRPQRRGRAERRTLRLRPQPRVQK